MGKVLSFTFQQCFGPFTCYFSKGPLKWDFLDIDLASIFGVRKLKYTSAIRVMFFLKKFKIESKFRRCKKKLRQNFSFLRQLHRKILQ